MNLCGFLPGISIKDILYCTITIHADYCNMSGENKTDHIIPPPKYWVGHVTPLAYTKKINKTLFFIYLFFLIQPLFLLWLYLRDLRNK